MNSAVVLHLSRPKCSGSLPTLFCHPEDEQRNLELHQGSSGQFSTHDSDLTWFFSEMHFLKHSSHNRGRETSGRQLVFFVGCWLHVLISRRNYMV